MFSYSCFIEVLTLIVYYYYYYYDNFIVILIVMWDPTGKITTDVLTLTCHCFNPAVYLAQKPEDGSVN